MNPPYPLLLTRIDDSECSSLRQWQVAPDERPTIGRSESCDIRIDHPRVSRRHTVLFFTRGNWNCLNVGRNGTYVDGHQVEQKELSQSTILRLSGHGPELQVDLPLNPDDGTPTAGGSVSMYLERLPDGDASAERNLWDRYFHRVAGLSRRRFGSNPRGASDDEDVAICVFRKLYEGVREGRYPELSNRDNLWRMLVVMARRQTRDVIEHESRQRRGGGKIWRESDWRDTEQSLVIGMDEVPDDQPSPEHIAGLEEQVRINFAKLDGELSDVAQLKLKGYTNQEISSELAVPVRTVERRLQRIRERWISLLSDV